MRRGRVGKVTVKIGLSNVNSAKYLYTDALIDTGADETVIPVRIARELGIKPMEQIWIRAGNGPVKVGVGGAKILLSGHLAYSNVWINDKLDKVLVGVTVLEQLGLKVNPKKGILEKEPQVLYAVNS